MEPEDSLGAPRLTKKDWLIIFLLSVFISPFVAALTSSFFPAFGSLIATFIVITMCIVVSRIPEDEQYSRSILLSITMVIVSIPYIFAFCFFRVDVLIINRTGSELGSVIVDYTWYDDTSGMLFKRIAPGESFRLHPCILYGDMSIHISWTHHRRLDMEDSQWASFYGPFDRFGENKLILLGEENLVREQ